MFHEGHSGNVLFSVNYTVIVLLTKNIHFTVKLLTVFVLQVDWRLWMDGAHTSVREQVCIRFAGPRKRRQ